ncbi:hypothetical protein KCP73_13290 [Salmonella enterica subsp. enterica]|nr:hypothetical protein KCP73_13290 [Salmonella enterica subsp. enterica]
MGILILAAGQVTGPTAFEIWSDGRSSATVPDHYRAVLIMAIADGWRGVKENLACGDGRWRLPRLLSPSIPTLSGRNRWTSSLHWCPVCS